MSTQALQLIQKCLDLKEPSLELGKTGLTHNDFIEGSAMDMALRQCIHLHTLILSNTWYDHNRRTWVKSKNTGKWNKIGITPPALRFLTQLSVFVCCGDLTNTWDIMDMSFVSVLKKLTRLDLSNNRISELKGLDQLSFLQILDLSDNQISELKGLAALTSLEQLYLGHNDISEINNLDHLTTLQVLDLGENQISAIKGLDHLDFLQILDLSENHISEIQGLEQLTYVSKLYLGHNKISNLKGLQYLSSLTVLDLEDNQIQDITPLLPFLVDIDSSKEIVFIENFAPGENWDEKKNLINLFKNPLAIPPLEIVQQGNDVVINYFNEIQEKGAERLYEAKMLIVGQPRAGKTTLRFKLFDTTPPLPNEEETTRGIDIERLHFDFINGEGRRQHFYYNVWDFGGQQIYQTTHQFFLTHRSLYVLVMDTGQDSLGNDDTTINYWLQMVELLSGGSPLLLVCNEKNQRRINLDIPQKRARFPFLRQVYNVDLDALIPNTANFDANRAKQFAILREDIETELQRLPLVGFVMPKNWVQIRKKLQEKSKLQPYITKQDYLEICKGFDVTDYERQMELSRIFHDLGVFLHFQDFSTLEDFIILQNVWATDSVFAVLDNVHIKDSKGKFTDADLSKIWKSKGYEPGVFRKLLALMMQFELCYMVDQMKPSTYIVPEMLPDRAPDGYSWEPKNDLHLFYQYDFMPKGILTRFIVRMHRYIQYNRDLQLVWKSGVLINGDSLGCPNTIAEITESWDNTKLSVRIQGRFSKALMDKITQEIDWLNDSVFKQVNDHEQEQKNSWYKMIPCNCPTCNSSNRKQFYDYNILLKAQVKGKNIQCQSSFDDVSVKELLDGVFTSVANNEFSTTSSPTTAGIYFSYAWGDTNETGESREKLVKELYLSLLQDNYQVVLDKYDLEYKGAISEFMGKIGQGKCIILVISQKYIKSPYCMFELYEIARNAKFDKFHFREKVLPIMAQFIDFTNPTIIEEYHAYWETEFNNWQKLLEKRAGQLSIEKMQRYDKVKMIYQNFDKLTEWIADMNTLNPAILSAHNFLEIKREINRMVANSKTQQV